MEINKCHNAKTLLKPEVIDLMKEDAPQGHFHTRGQKAKMICGHTNSTNMKTVGESDPVGQPPRNPSVRITTRAADPKSPLGVMP